MLTQAGDQAPSSIIHRWLSKRSGWGNTQLMCSRNPPRDSDVIGLWWGALGMDIFSKSSPRISICSEVRNHWRIRVRAVQEEAQRLGSSLGKVRVVPGALGRSVVKVERMSINNNNKMFTRCKGLSILFTSIFPFNL